jgi:hypothetical protein
MYLDGWWKVAIDRCHVRKAAANDNDMRIERIDNPGDAARKGIDKVLIMGERQRIAGFGCGNDRLRA